MSNIIQMPIKDIGMAMHIGTIRQAALIVKVVEKRLEQLENHAQRISRDHLQMLSINPEDMGRELTLSEHLEIHANFISHIKEEIMEIVISGLEDSGEEGVDGG